MAHVYKDRVNQTCPAPTGAAAFVFTTTDAVDGFQQFVDALADGETCIYSAEDTASPKNWEVGLGTWTEATESLARTTILSSSNAGAAESFTGTVTVGLTVDSSTIRNSYLRTKASSADAAVTGEVGTMHVLDISGLTADRDFTLPATAAVGDRVGVMLSVGDATYELLIKPAAGDTINGGSAGAEWSRLFITGEVVILRCVTADSAWMVEYAKMDEYAFRVRQNGNATPQQTLATAAFDAIDGQVLNTTMFDTGSSLTNVNSSGNPVTFTARRAGKYMFEGLVVISGPATGSDGKKIITAFGVNGAASADDLYLASRGMNSADAFPLNGFGGPSQINLAVGDYVTLLGFAEATSSAISPTDNYIMFSGRWLNV